MPNLLHRFSDVVDTASPTDAHRAVLALLHNTVVEAARRRQDDLPGLVETLQDDVMLSIGWTSRQTYGWFAPGTWRLGDRQVHELFVNADSQTLRPPAGSAEEALVTLLHEACHVWAQANGIADTSRDGRYHNRRFAEIALAIGLQIERHAAIGHHTPRLSARGRFDFDDLLTRLKDGLNLVREPQLNTSVAEDKAAIDDAVEGAASSAHEPSGKYVFAACQCTGNHGNMVIIRVASGSWRPHAIYCSICQSPFVESPSTSQRKVRR